MIIRGEKIILRAVSDADTDSIIEWRNNEAVAKYFIVQQPITLESHSHWMKSVMAGTTVQFIIIDAADNKDVGTVFLKDIDRTHNKAECGIFLGESCARGKGFGSEAVELITQYAFEELGLNKVYARVLAFNCTSQRVFLKNGFSREGRFSKDVFIRGEYVDVIFFAKQRNE